MNPEPLKDKFELLEDGSLAFDMIKRRGLRGLIPRKQVEKFKSAVEYLKNKISQYKGLDSFYKEILLIHIKESFHDLYHTSMNSREKLSRESTEGVLSEEKEERKQHAMTSSTPHFTPGILKDQEGVVVGNLAEKESTPELVKDEITHHYTPKSLSKKISLRVATAQEGEKSHSTSRPSGLDYSVGVRDTGASAPDPFIQNITVKLKEGVTLVVDSSFPRFDEILELAQEEKRKQEDE